MFATEIFTAISQIPEEPPEVIHINKMHEMLWKEMAILDWNPLTSLAKYENNKKEYSNKPIVQ